MIINLPSFEGVPESDLCFGTRLFNYVCFFQAGHILKPLSRLAICLHCQRLDQSHWLRSGEVDDALEMEEKTEAAAVEARPLLAAIKTGYLPLSKKSRRSMVKPI